MLLRAQFQAGDVGSALVNFAFPPETEELPLLAIRGLKVMYRPGSQEFVYTTRGVPGQDGPRLVGEGTSLRYSAIAAMGLNWASDSEQRAVLGGSTADALSASVVVKAQTSTDPGALALAAWVAAEVENRCDTALFARLRDLLRNEAALPTVDVAWMLSAAAAAQFAGPSDDVASMASKQLLREQGLGGLFPHALPPERLGRIRRHVGSFADQIYPIQALARLAAATADAVALAAANRCAARICAVQGDAGQWWWHYDARGGSVVERFPVYSVHQHAMAPMALLDLFNCGGDDHRDAVLQGLSWLDHHPEVLDELLDERFGVIWRKVGRREPPKTARKLQALTTAVHPQLSIPLLDRVLPATVVDHECRPYELGWLLYAWLRPGAAAISERHTRGDSND